ncbi:MAG: hypothetical protein WCV82_00670 [Candidatus Paceibacterota bacterium]
MPANDLLKALKLLVVDGEPATRELLLKLLIKPTDVEKQDGAEQDGQRNVEPQRCVQEIQTVVNVSDAFALMNTSYHPDIILIGLGGGREGIDMARSLQRRRHPAKVIFMAASFMNYNARELRELGSCTLHKPLSSNQVRAALVETMISDLFALQRASATAC